MLTLFQDAAAQGLIAGDVIAIGDPQPRHDAHAPFMSLPRLFQTTPDTVPDSVPYLAARPPRPELVLPDNGRRRIGLVWAGSPFNKMDAQRSIRAEHLIPLLDATEADFVSLQVGPGAEQSALFPENRLVFAAHDKVRDFADTAAVAAQLDLIIGVDTAAIHLAAALGKPVWLLLAAAPDYRWLLNRTDSPWYPAIRLFRQEKCGDWPAVIAAVRAALTTW
jgi:ADP-heptose:LPS heptosyltransferase